MRDSRADATSRRDDARGTRPELARTRRADGGARRSIPDADRRGALRAKRRASADLKALVEAPPQRPKPVDEPVDFPSWNRTWPVRLVRRAVAGHVDPAARARVRVHARRGARAPARPERPGDLRGQSPESLRRAGDPGGDARRVRAHAWRRRWRRSSSRRTSSPPASRGAQCSPTRSTITCRRSSSTRSRCRSARPARGRRCGTSASCPARAGRS